MRSSINSLVSDADSRFNSEAPSPTVSPLYLVRVKPRLDDDPEVDIPISDEPKDAEYYLDTVLFEVEGTLYKVAKYHFLKSQVLTATFAKYKSEHDVIFLNDVSRDDFRTLLKLLYPLSIMSTNNFTTEEWTSVLRLSTRWKMLDLRNLAIRQLNMAKIDPIDRIDLAQKYHIPRWLISSLIPLIRREAGLSTDEAAKLGFELALKICRIRDSSRTLPDVPDDDAWNSAISAEFKGELQLQAISAVEQVIRARKTGVFEFLRASYLNLVERPEALSNDEAMELGCETTARICRIREQRIAQNLSTASSTGLVEDELQAELGTTTSLSAIQRVVLARSNVAQWLRMSLVEAAQGRQFSNDEVESIGKETTVRLFKVRETVYSTQWDRKSSDVCRTMVNKEFSDEIRAIRDRAKGYSGTEEASAANEIVDETDLRRELIYDNARDDKEGSTKANASVYDEDKCDQYSPRSTPVPAAVETPKPFKSDRPLSTGKPGKTAVPRKGM